MRNSSFIEFDQLNEQQRPKESDRSIDENETELRIRRRCGSTQPRSRSSKQRREKRGQLKVSLGYWGIHEWAKS